MLLPCLRGVGFSGCLPDLAKGSSRTSTVDPLAQTQASQSPSILPKGSKYHYGVYLYLLVAEWIHFTLFGIILPTIKLKVYTFWGLMNSATKMHPKPYTLNRSKYIPKRYLDPWGLGFRGSPQNVAHKILRPSPAPRV